MRVFVIKIVLANVDYREFPQRREIHHFIQHALSQCSLAKKAHRHLPRAQPLRGERRARRNSRATPHNGIRPQIPCRRIGNVHRPALAPAIPRFFSQQFGKHAVGRSALCQAVPVTAVRAGDVVGLLKRFANPYCHRFFPNIQMRQARHERARIKLVHLLLKLADHHHTAIDARPLLRFDTFNHLALIRGNGHWETPAIFAKTSNTTAKSLSATPMPRAAVKNSFVAAVVGMGTSNCRPSSSASSMSFCIMLTLNHASSGIFSTNGPRYSTIGDAITLCVSTSTAVSLLIPLFSASRTPSQNASICTARLKFTPIFITSACPFSPTCVTFGPMSCSSDFTFSNVSLRPPAITESLPSCKVITLPETGESTRSPPFSRTFSAISRLNAGLTVLRSTRILPGFTPASIPSGPFITAANAAELVTMESVMSLALTTSLGVFAHFIPFCISHSAFERVRLYPVTVWPLPSSRFTISLPITPKPTNPRFAMKLSLPLNRSFYLWARQPPRALPESSRTCLMCAFIASRAPAASRCSTASRIFLW